jgi:hypothetical protein
MFFGASKMPSKHRDTSLGSLDQKRRCAGEVDFRDLLGAIQEAQHGDQDGENNGGVRSPLVSLTRDGSMLAELYQAYQYALFHCQTVTLIYGKEFSWLTGYYMLLRNENEQCFAKHTGNTIHKV